MARARVTPDSQLFCRLFETEGLRCVIRHRSERKTVVRTTGVHSEVRLHSELVPTASTRHTIRHQSEEDVMVCSTGLHSDVPLHSELVPAASTNRAIRSRSDELVPGVTVLAHPVTQMSNKSGQRAVKNRQAGAAKDSIGGRRRHDGYTVLSRWQRSGRKGTPLSRGQLRVSERHVSEFQ